MVIFNSYVSLPEGKFPLSYGFPMVSPFFDAAARDEPICGEPGDADHQSSSRQGEVRLPRAPDARHDLPAEKWPWLLLHGKPMENLQLWPCLLVITMAFY